jgi:pyruvate-formate lyase-activating enzyme
MTDDKRSIATWVRSDDTRPHCTRPWNMITVLSDGSVVCAPIDAGKTNPLGSFRTQTLAEIWDGAPYRKLRQDIHEDIDRTPICRGCPNRIVGRPPGELTGIARPRVLHLESQAGCNLVCPGCDRDAIEGTRDGLTMDWELYTRVIDQLAPELRFLEFHVGGENWMHRRACDMVRYCKEKNPGCVVLSSTNGHFFHTDERARDAVSTGVDCFIISADGATQASYEKYRVRGSLERVFDGMRRLLRARRELGRERPILVWRYILFPWSDSEEEMALARRLAREIGVDHLCWHLNGAQQEFSSSRYYVGSPHLGEIESELWDTLPARLGYSALDFERF